MSKNKKALISSFMALVMTMSMFAGTTFSWFTDAVKSGENTINAGILSIDMLHLDTEDENADENGWVSMKKNKEHTLFEYDHWEPGYTQYETIKIANTGNLAFKYQLKAKLDNEITGTNGESLTDVIEVYVAEGVQTPDLRTDIIDDTTGTWTKIDTLADAMLMVNGMTSGVLLPESEEGKDVAETIGEEIITIALHMQETADNSYQGLSLGDFYLDLSATQYTYEEDSFGKDYDAEAFFPENNLPVSASKDISNLVENGVLTEEVVITGPYGVSVIIPAGVKVEDGVTELKLIITEKDKSDSNVTAEETEELKAFDVHVEGIAEDNEVPMTIEMGKILPTGLNKGNLKLYHVEDGASVAMTEVDAAEDFTAHNQFTYNPATGSLTLYMATFSEVTVLADTENAWNGVVETRWYEGDTTELTIANADQLAGLGELVSGGNDFSGKTVSLTNDVNLGGAGVKDEGGKLLFYPIGYTSEGYKGSFSGTFDGTGHTISNLYQNGWEMTGTYDAGYYNDAMGLFGYVYNGTVKNLTLNQFEMVMEFAPMGCVTAYGGGEFCTFENIALTSCHPQTYNTGVAGIVGWDTSNDDVVTDYTFKNITIDQTNTITALWGTWDCAAGGLMGRLHGTSTASMENCHVAAKMDVYNDVCANYQYYWYRYCGMLIGTVDKTKKENGYTVLDLTNIEAKNCTVNFGDWNDYYYCELVANSLASYTHDHQFSRLTEVAIENEVPTTGSGNYVVVNRTVEPKTAICYHYVNGEKWEHSEAGKETIDGVEVDKEDKTLVNLPFNQVFGGYGWGVKGTQIDELEGITVLGIVESSTNASEEKFESSVEEGATLPAGVEIRVGNLFEELDGELKTAVNDASVYVSVSPADEESSVSGTFTASTTGYWEDGTLFIDGTGAARITIQDYQYCKPTVITVKVEIPTNEVKFAHVFENTNDYLYRVGNSNEVSIGSLFKNDGDNTVAINAEKVTVSVESVDTDITVSGTYSASTTGYWEDGTLQFTGTGPVKVTITDNQYCTPTELYLEVVEGYNITKTSEIKSYKNNVFLNDIIDGSGANVHLESNTTYGNGFIWNVSNYDTTNSKTYANITLKNANLDNIRIIGKVYPEVAGTYTENYFPATIRAQGYSTINNSYVSNSRVPVRIDDAYHVKIINSTIDGGRYANIELRSGRLTLEDVTTVQNIQTADDAQTGVMGFGIVIFDEAGSNTKLNIEGKLKQYNWIGESTHAPYFSEGDLSTAFKLIFNSGDENMYYTYDGERYINTGILCLSSNVPTSNVTDVPSNYISKDVSYSSYNGWVMSNDMTLKENTSLFEEGVPAAEEFVPVQTAYKPTFTGVNLNGTTEKTVEFTKGETYQFDPHILTVIKHGQSLTVSSVEMDGKTYNAGETIPLTESGVYTINYTVVDSYNYDANGNVSGEVTYKLTMTLNVSAVDPQIKDPDFVFIDQNGNKYTEVTYVTVGDKTYVMPVFDSIDSTTNTMSSINKGSTTVDGVAINFPISTGYTVREGSSFYRYYPLFSGINVTDYNVAGDTTGTTYTAGTDYTSMVGTSEAKFIIPTGHSTNCGDYVQSTGQAGNASGNSSSGGWQGAGYNTNYGGTYLKSGSTNASNGSDANGYERIVWVEYSFNAGNDKTYYYRIGYHCNAEKPQTCVTPDTLVTLADGSQKEIQHVTYEDELLVWDFYKGEYAVMPSSIVMNHGYDTYRVLTLKFADGTTVNTINGHGFFDAYESKFIILSEKNVEDYIGHKFVKHNGDGYSATTLIDYSVKEEYTESWSVLTAVHYNCILEGMLTLTPAEVEGSPDYLMPFEINNNMKYDKFKMLRDIRKYGLYTYDEFSEYMTREQFEALNLANFKVSVGKGYISYDEIMKLIGIHITN